MIYVSNDLPSHPEIDGYAPGARGDLPPTVRLSGPSTRLVRPWGVALDTAGQAMFAALMGDHLGRGGLIIAATHAPLGIAARELRIGGAA